jgi:Uma2 family endonuclease
MVALATLPVHISVDEFLAWAPASPDRWQLVDGVPIAMAPASLTHGARHHLARPAR